MSFIHDVIVNDDMMTLHNEKWNDNNCMSVGMPI